MGFLSPPKFCLSLSSCWLPNKQHTRSFAKNACPCEICWKGKKYHCQTKRFYLLDIVSFISPILLPGSLRARPWTFILGPKRKPDPSISWLSGAAAHPHRLLRRNHGGFPLGGLIFWGLWWCWWSGNLSSNVSWRWRGKNKDVSCELPSLKLT